MFTMPRISIWMNRKNTIPGDSVMLQHMAAMVGELHRPMTAQIARIRRYLRYLCGLVLLLRMRRLLHTRLTKFVSIDLEKVELYGLVQLSRKSMEFDPKSVASMVTTVSSELGRTQLTN